MLKACPCRCQQCWGGGGRHLGTPFPGMVCRDAGQPLTHQFSALTGGGHGKFEPIYFPAKAWSVLTPFLPLGAAILPSLDLEVIPINIYESFMIKRGISPFIFQTCPNTHRPAPKPRTAGRQLPPCAGVSRDAHPKTSGESAGSGSPSRTRLHGIASAFLPSLSPQE